MDTTAKDIVFDQQGYCNYCNDFLLRHRKQVVDDLVPKKQELQNLVKRIKETGKGKKYDCVVGLSGGADSSYVLYEVKNLGLRPLVVHMDNGWNSELAQNNILNLVTKLRVDLETYVIDWEEYRALMQAFFDADVIDIELLYDNAMLAVNYKMASRYGIKYILSGSNTATEGMKIPSNWNWFKIDKKNIYALAKRNQVKIKTFPSIGLAGYLYNRFIKKIKWIAPLDYMDYHKADCMKFLEENYGFKPYPYKHYESIFTRFYQGYLLPKKFGVDKRKVHFSTLVMSNQMTREEALAKMAESPYPSEQDINNDMAYFLKKMKWNQVALKDYLARPEIKHDTYDSERPLAQKLESLWKVFK